MSRPRHRIHPKFLALLHDRGWTVEKLARLAGTGRAHANQVLAGVPGRGYRTRGHLAVWLTAAERELLGWDELGRVRSPFLTERSKPLSATTNQPNLTRPNV